MRKLFLQLPVVLVIILRPAYGELVAIKSPLEQLQIDTEQARKSSIKMDAIGTISRQLGTYKQQPADLVLGIAAGSTLFTTEITTHERGFGLKIEWDNINKE